MLNEENNICNIIILYENTRIRIELNSVRKKIYIHYDEDNNVSLIISIIFFFN